MAGAAEHRLERWQSNVDHRDVQDRHEGAYPPHARDLQHSGIDLVGQLGEVALAWRRHVFAPRNGFLPVYARLVRNPPYEPNQSTPGTIRMSRTAPPSRAERASW